MQQLIGFKSGDSREGFIGIAKSSLQAVVVLKDENSQRRSIGGVLDGPLPAGEFLDFEFQLSCLSDILEMAQFADRTIFQPDGNTSYLKKSPRFWQTIFLDKADIVSFKLVHHRPGTGRISLE